MSYADTTARSWHNKLPSNLSGRLVLAGLLLPLLIYGFLPLLGIGKFADVLSLKRVVLLLGAMAGGLVYVVYLRFVLQRPQVPIAFVLWAWPTVAYLNEILIVAGLNIHLRPLLILVLAVPAVGLAFKHRVLLWHEVPWFKYYMLFFGWLLVYFFFFNAHASDQMLAGGDNTTFSEGSVAMVQMTSYFYCLMGIMLGGITMLKSRHPAALFDSLNVGLLWVSIAVSLFTIVGFSFGLTSMPVDGFTRAMGLFSHPNPYAHHMGILMLYLLGLFCYYQGERQGRVSGGLLVSAMGIGLVAFLLGLSKTSLVVFFACGVVLLLMNLSVSAVRKSFLSIFLALVILIPLGLFAFQFLSGDSFFTLLESRIEQTDSLRWRTEIWDVLLSGLDVGSIWLGHGFTAANEMIFRFTFDNAKNSKPLMMVHNAYIGLLYDLGVMGYMMFVAALSMGFHCIRGWFHSSNERVRVLLSTVFVMSIYFLVVCGFDEMSYMFDAPMLFWLLATMLACLSCRKEASV